MAINGSPTVIEPSSSSDSPMPTIPSLSPNASSSSDSFDSSRPDSQGTRGTSRSVSPIPKEHTSASQSQCQNGTSTSVSSEPVGGHAIPWFHRLRSLIFRRNRFTNTLGAISLGLTLIGTIIFGERTYKLAVWAAWHDMLDSCDRKISEGRDIGLHCQNLLKQTNQTNDVNPPPYHLKRTWHAFLKTGLWPRPAWNETLATCRRLVSTGFEVGSNCKELLSNNNVDVTASDGITPRTSSTVFYTDSFKESSLPNGRFGGEALDSSFLSFLSIAAVPVSMIIVGGLSFIIIFRHYWKTEEVFTSPVRSDWRFTRHHQKGPETVSEEGYRMITRNPRDGHPLGQLRQRIRSSQPNAVQNPTGEPNWQPHNTSEDTLVGPLKDTKWADSKVSLTNDTSDEKHENLIELETEGPNKTFFDPETGEFIHLSPWKSTGEEEVRGLKPDGKGSIKHAFARMALGATGWAGGKNIDDQLAEELQANSRSEEKESETHTAGDCVTGDMLNESPSGKPTMDPIAAVNEHDTCEVDLKVTAFLLRKPWYAGMSDITDEDAATDIDDEGAGAVEELDLESTSDCERKRTACWISQAPLNKRLIVSNTFKDTNCLSHNMGFVVRELPRIENGDVHAALAKAEGRDPKSQVGSSTKEVGPTPNVETQSQVMLAETSNGKQYWLQPKRR